MLTIVSNDAYQDRQQVCDHRQKNGVSIYSLRKLPPIKPVI